MSKIILIFLKFFSLKNTNLGAHFTQWPAVWTQNPFTPLLTHPQGSQGCQKFFLQIKLLSSCAKIDPKLQKFQKTLKIEKKLSKKPCFLNLFQIFFNFGSIFFSSWPISMALDPFFLVYSNLLLWKEFCGQDKFTIFYFSGIA